jgi:hypothetical protein
MAMLHCAKTRRAAVCRSNVTLALVAALALAGCAGSRSGSMSHDGSDAGYSGRDDLAARCERDRGIWRPEIAGGYCERKP